MKNKLVISLLCISIIVLVVTAFGCGTNTTKTPTAKVDGENSGATTGMESAPQPGTEIISLGGGCFWCTEAVFKDVEGVVDTTVGYAGGTTADPDYEAVCGGETGHAEVVSITYDSQVVSLESLLDIFFASHDPTTEDRQGNDVGDQYRSIILTTSDSQRQVVQDYIDGLESEYEDPIVTQVETLEAFYTAEEYHQDYYEKNPDQPYCSSVISPKLEEVKDKLGQ